MKDKGKGGGYVGKLGHGGTQVIDAPAVKKDSRKKGTVIKGEDLRTGKGNGGNG